MQRKGQYLGATGVRRRFRCLRILNIFPGRVRWWRPGCTLGLAKCSCAYLDVSSSQAPCLDVGALHIEHAITDLTAWQPAFNQFARARAQASVRSQRVQQPVDDDPTGVGCMTEVSGKHLRVGCGGNTLTCDVLVSRSPRGTHPV